LKDRFSCGACLVIDNDVYSSFSKEVISVMISFHFHFRNFIVLPGGLADRLAGESDKLDETVESTSTVSRVAN